MARVMEDSAQNIPALMTGRNIVQQKGTANIEEDAALAARKQMVTPAQVAAVRARLSPEEAPRCSDALINQFLRATVCNIDQVCLLPCTLLDK